MTLLCGLSSNLHGKSTRFYSCNNHDQADHLKQEYSKLRNEYSGLPLLDNVVFDTELVSITISGV